MNYRIYIDETGTCSMSRPSDENNRYLGLTGIIFEEPYARTVAAPMINAVKTEFFGSTDVVLHRKEIMDKVGPFRVLRDEELCERFNSSVLHLLHNLEFSVITAIIDKKELLERYDVWRAEPYHYCMEVLLERYCLFLKKKDAAGDVVIESRSKNQDKKLKKAYMYYYRNGTSWVKPKDIQCRLTSQDIKLRPKTANILGLQLADLLAHPSAMYAKAVRSKVKVPATFGGKIARIMHDKKYCRSDGGKIMGWGVKWLP